MDQPLPSSVGGAAAPPTSLPVASGIAPIPGVAPQDAICLQCGYQIPGMASDRNCPECGTPIARSLRGSLLVFSATGYLRQLHVGLLCILWSAVLSVLFGLIAMAVVIFIAIGISSQMTAGTTGGAATNPAATNPAAGAGMPAAVGILGNIELYISAGGMLLAGLAMLGWWLFSAPDPAIIQKDRGQTPRLVLRTTVVIAAACTVLSFIIQAIAHKDPSLMVLSGLPGLLSGAASLVQFFAAMLYVKWLAPRIPDLQILNRASLYMWLLPVIFVVGVCVIIGPLVAQIMYLLLLNRVRIRLRDIRATQLRDFPVTAS